MVVSRMTRTSVLSVVSVCQNGLGLGCSILACLWEGGIEGVDWCGYSDVTFCVKLSQRYNSMSTKSYQVVPASSGAWITAKSMGDGMITTEQDVRTSIHQPESNTAHADTTKQAKNDGAVRRRNEMLPFSAPSFGYICPFVYNNPCHFSRQ